jgi:hypothetical protein
MALRHMMPKTAKAQLGLDLDPKSSPRDGVAPYVSDPDRF